VILSATYLLSLVQRLFYGPQSDMIAVRPADDLHVRELAVLCPIVALTLVMGVAPSIWLPAIKQGVRPRPNPAQMLDTHFVAEGGPR
jgi:NADH-quinone oxidoreductase subunit M